MCCVRGNDDLYNFLGVLSIDRGVWSFVMDLFICYCFLVMILLFLGRFGKFCRRFFVDRNWLGVYWV